MPSKNKLRKFWNEKARTQLFSGFVVALLALTVATGFFVALPKQASADDLSGWQYYKVCNINASGYSEYYQMKINVTYSGGDVDCEGHCQADFDDIRFVDIDNSTVLPYWKEIYVDSNYAIFWVNVSADAMSDGKILMYYGNEGATDASDGDATFDFFDDFEGESLDMDKWNENAIGGTYEVSSSILTVIGNSSGVWESLGAKTQFTPPIIIEFYAKMTEQDKTTIGIDDRSATGSASGTGIDRAAWQYVTEKRYRVQREEGITDISRTSDLSTYKKLKIAWTSSFVKFYEDEELITTCETNVPADPCGVQFEVSGTSNYIYCDYVFARQYADPEPSWSSFSSEHTQSGNTTPSVSNPSPANGYIGVDISLSQLSCYIYDSEGDLMDWTIETLPDIGSASGNNAGNGTITCGISGLSPVTTYTWYVNVTDGTSWTNKVFTFTTFLSNNTLPFTVDYNNSIDDKIIKSYSEGGGAIPKNEQELTNTVAVYDDINDCFYVFYFTPSNQSSSGHVCVKKYWISNNTFSPEFQFPISGSDWQHSFPVGQSWGTPADRYESHVKSVTWLDEYNHIYVMYGGHATSTYPITVFRSTVPLSQLQYTNISQWERTGNVTGVTGSAYQTPLHVKSGYYKGYTILYYRQGAQGGSDYFAWSNDNGTTWTTRLFSDDASYGRRGWFYDDVWKEWIFLYVPAWQDWSSNFHFCWATIDDIINGTGMRSSSQTITDTPAYSFPLTSSSIPRGVDNWGDTGYDGFAIAYNSSEHRVYISYIDTNTGDVYLVYKELSSPANWTEIEIDNVDVNSRITDMSFVYNESILMMTSAEVNGTEWEWKIRWSNNPLDNSTWHKYNATATTIPTNSCTYAYWPNIQVYEDSDGNITGEIVFIYSMFKWVDSPVLDIGHTIEEGIFTYIDLREEAGNNSLPTVSITSPSDGATVNGTVSITGTASDSDGTVQSVEVRIDSGTWQTATGTTSWSYSWDSTGVSDGTHTIYARSYDGTDYSTEDSVAVTVDNTAPNQPPTVSITSPSEGATVNGTITITGTASDSDGTVQSVEVKIGSDAWATASGTTSWTFTWDTTGYSDGSYTILARSYDGTNYSTEAQVNVTVNNTDPSTNHAPAITLNSPGNGSTDVDINVSLNVTVSDPDGDSMTITFWNWTGSEWISWGQLTNKGNGTYTYKPYAGGFAYNTTYTWRASVSDGSLSSNSETWAFTTAPQNTTPNQPPTAAFTYSINDLTVTFTDGSTDSDGTIASWNWSFGDGQYTVTDNDGATNTVSESITLATGGGNTVSSDINTWYLIIGIMAFAIVAMMMVVFAGKRR